MFILPIDLYLGIMLKSDSELGITEGNNLHVRLRRLISELIARKIKYLKPLRLMSLIYILQVIILWSETALCRRVHDKHNLAAVLLHSVHYSHYIICLKIIKALHYPITSCTLSLTIFIPCVGSNLSTKFPSLSIRNLVKFHFILLLFL